MLYRVEWAGSGTLPCGRSRLRCFTVWEEPAHVLCRVGGTGSGILPLVGQPGLVRWLPYYTVWVEPAPVLSRLGREGRGDTLPCAPPSLTHTHVRYRMEGRMGGGMEPYGAQLGLFAAPLGQMG